MKKKSKNAGQASPKTHTSSASKRSAKWRLKSRRKAQSASIHADQSVDVTHFHIVSSGARSSVKSTDELPRKIKRGHSRSEIHSSAASQRPATLKLKSIRLAQDASLSNGHHGVEAHETDAIAADDHNGFEIQDREVIGTQSKRGHELDDTHFIDASLGDDHVSGETQPHTVISTIKELWKNRQSWHRAEKSLTLQGKAQCRRFTGGDKVEANKLFASIIAEDDGQGFIDNHVLGAITSAILPFIEARKPLEAHRKLIEKELTRLAKSLPVYPWAEEIKGFGPLSLAAIVGCAGDLSNYATPSRLWKRMGLAVINGKRQRRVSDAIEALQHGYSPERRSVMFNIGGCLIGGMGRGPRPACGKDIQQMADLSPYQIRFIELIRAEVERITETWNGPEHKREPVEKNGKLYESYSSHAANRIRRRIEKEFLCDLLVAWKACSTTKTIKPTWHLSDKPILQAAE